MSEKLKMKRLFKNKTIRFFVKFTICLVLLLLLIFHVKWHEVIDHIKSVSVFFLAMYLVIILCSILISSYKWWILAVYKNFSCSVQDCFQMYLIGIFINNFLPSIIGGDTYRAYQLGDSKKEYSLAASTVVFDRIIGLTALVFLAVIFSFFNIPLILSKPFWMWIMFFLVFFLLSDFIILIFKNFKVVRLLFSKLPEAVQIFFRSVRLFYKPRILVTAFLLSIVFSFVGVAFSNYILFWAFGVHIPFLDYLSVIFIISIISSVPISINNIGVKEWAYVTFFPFIGVSIELAVTVALISRFLQMLLSFLGLPAYLREKREKKMNMSWK